jgi:hypothetical protein
MLAIFPADSIKVGMSSRSYRLCLIGQHRTRDWPLPY